MNFRLLSALFLASVGSAWAQSAATPSFALANFSLRARLDVPQALVVGGSLAGGSGTILFRAAGPVLSQFGVAGAPNPRLQVFGGNGAEIATNDDWNVIIAPQFAAVGAFPFPASSRDAALAQPLNGTFTAHARVDAPGDVLLEVYDPALAFPRRLTNISARLRVGNGQAAILGFVTAGTGSKRLLVRAVGQTLGLFGVAGTMSNPTLQVYDGARREIAANDNWDSALDADFRAVNAFQLPALSTDAALSLTVSAGNAYTVHVSGADLQGGEVLIELYELP